MASMSRIHAAAVAAAGALLLAGCGAAAAPPLTGSTSSATSPTASAGAVGSATLGDVAAPPAQPTIAPPPAPSYPTTARAYAEATVAAWSGHHLGRLADLTTTEVDEQFLEIPGQLKDDWIYHDCDGVAGSQYCTLRNGDGDSVTLKVTTQYLGGPHAVRQLTASLTTYPTDGEAYASEFVRAWASSNTPRMRALARPDVVVEMNNEHQDRPDGTWMLVVNGHHGGAGLLIVAVGLGENDQGFTLDVGTTLLGGKHAIIGYGPPYS